MIVPPYLSQIMAVSHASTQVGQNPKWPPDWFTVKGSEITADYSTNQWRYTFHSIAFKVGLENTIGNFEEKESYVS